MWMNGTCSERKQSSDCKGYCLFLDVRNRYYIYLTENIHSPVKTKIMGDFKDLLFYRKAFDNAMRVFELSKKFPPEEKYALTSQSRDSSRSVCSCISEGYRKRRYVRHWVSKLSDADMENSETIVWLDFAKACKYIQQSEHTEMINRYKEVGRMLNFAIDHPEKFI
jgi:four helix bundle protein